jgi:peptidoglycan/LPS O-acetylase OafA/YrhL
MKPLDRHIPELDGLRGAAVLLVVIFHYISGLPQGIIIPGTIPAYLLAPIRLGFTGVDLFFVLSGFLIGSMLLRMSGQGTLRSFYIRRAARTWPLYYVLLFLFLLGVAGEHFGAWYYPKMFGDANHLWAYFAFLQNPLSSGENAMNPTWSLAIEEQFYLFFPLLFLKQVSARMRMMQLSALAACSIAVRYATGAQFLNFSRLDGLAIGAMIAMIFAEPQLLGKVYAKSYWLISVTAVLAGGMLVETKRIDAMGLMRFTFFALFYASLLMTILIVPKAGALFRAPTLRFFGDISYGLYMVHVPILMFFNAKFVGPEADPFSEKPIVCTILSAGVSVSIAYLSTRFFEQPIRAAIREKMLPRKREQAKSLAKSLSL